MGYAEALKISGPQRAVVKITTMIIAFEIRKMVCFDNVGRLSNPRSVRFTGPRRKPGAGPTNWAVNTLPFQHRRLCAKVESWSNL